jgi:hypothetical protein
MSNLNKIMTVSICALFALATGCNEVHIDNNGDDREPLSFSATSTKATTSLSEFHQDFGVWGIARRNDGIAQNPYILWRENGLTDVDLNSSVVYVPTSPAYWFSNHTYHFIAVAPFEIGATDVNVITKEENTPAGSGSDALSFTYSIADKYAAKEYVFDLMGAVATSEVDVAATHTSSQPITFKHLFSQIKINVSFKDGETELEGSVQKIRLKKISSVGQYTITFNTENSGSTDADLLSVSCVADATETSSDVVFEPSDQTSKLTFPQTLHILPQDVSKFELYLDFKIGSGAEALTLNDFKVNLSTANNTPSFYDYNQSRNWNITISPKASISFTIDVTPWVNSNVGNELEIY